MKKRRTSLYVDEDTLKRVIAAAKQWGISRVKWVRMALDLLALPELADMIREWIDKNGKQS